MSEPDQFIGVYAKQSPYEDEVDADRESIPLPGPQGLRASLADAQRPGEWAFATMALHRATTPAQRETIVFGQGVAVVIRVPTAGWIQPVVDVLRFHALWDKTVTGVPSRTGPSADENHTAAACLGRGGRILGVSTDPQRYLPASLVAAADVFLTLTGPDDATVARVIAAVLGCRAPSGIPAGVAAGLDMTDLVAAIRHGSTATRCVERLVAAAASKTVVDASVEAAPLLGDLHGYGEAMTWCTDLVAELDAWRAGKAPFPEAPNVVLAGPPGTGKTTLVRSLARTLRVPLIATSVAQWFSDSPGHLDSIVKAVNLTFERARALAPCVVLLDELDALPNRASLSDRGRDWWLPVITHMLLTLDSAVSGATRGLIVVGATNHADALDAALVRPGRLERVIEVLPPKGAIDRAAILRGHIGRDLPAEMDLATIGAMTVGATGADLVAIARQARRRARGESRPVTVDDVMYAAAPPDTRPEVVQRRFALHESGHAVVGQAMGLEVRLLTTVASGSTGGMCAFMPFGQHCVTLAEGRDHATMWLGGTAAEEVILGERSTGAGGPSMSDLGRATDLLRTLRTSHGLGRTLSHNPVADDAPPWTTPPQIAADVEADLQACLVHATAIVVERRAAVMALADALLERRVIDGATVRGIIAQHPPNVTTKDPLGTATSEPDRTPPAPGPTFKPIH